MQQLHEVLANCFFSTCFVLFLIVLGFAVTIKSLIEISMPLDDDSAIGSLATGVSAGPSDASERSELSGASHPD